MPGVQVAVIAGEEMSEKGPQKVNAELRKERGIPEPVNGAVFHERVSECHREFVKWIYDIELHLRGGLDNPQKRKAAKGDRGRLQDLMAAVEKMRDA